MGIIKLIWHNFVGTLSNERGGSTKVKTETAGTTVPTPTAEETELNKLLLERTRATQAGTISAQQAGLGLINQLLLGQQPTGELYQQMQGISPEAIGQQATQLTRQNLPQFQNLGLLDSGTMFKGISRDIANQLLFPAEQFNVGAKQNLLNLALSGQAQVQQPIQWGTQTLANQLAGLRTIQTTGQMAQTTRNPFLSYFSPSATWSQKGGWGFGI